MVSPESVSLTLLLVLHFALFVWAAKKIFKSEIPGFEKASWFLVCLMLPLLGPGIYAAYAKEYILKKELLHIVLAMIILGFLFSFRLWGVEVFSARDGFYNWLRMGGLAILALGGHILAQKSLAKRYDAVSRFKLWGLGVALALLVIFFTNGWFIWAAIGCAAVSTPTLLRPGRKIEREAISPFEVSKIMAAGTFASLGLAVVGKLLIPYLGTLARQFMNMNLWIAVFSIVPLFLVRLNLSLTTSWISDKFFKKKGRPLDKFVKNKWAHAGPSWMVLEKATRRIGEIWLSEGEILLFGSRPLWIFTFVFAVVMTVMIIFFGAIASVITAAILAVVMFAIWHGKMEPQKWARR